MNDILLAGLVIAGTVLVLGGGGWVMSVLSRKKNGPGG